jgi:transposase
LALTGAGDRSDPGDLPFTPSGFLRRNAQGNSLTGTRFKRCRHWYFFSLSLPPYSPDLNPIELSFAKLKAHLRKAKERTLPALYNRIGLALDTFQANKFRNYFRKSGYAST